MESLLFLIAATILAGGRVARSIFLGRAQPPIQRPPKARPTEF